MYIFRFFVKMQFLRRKSSFSPRGQKPYRSNCLLVVLKARFAKIRYFDEIQLFRENPVFSQKCRIPRKCVFAPGHFSDPKSGPRSLHLWRFLARGAKIAYFSTCSVKISFFSGNWENPLNLQNMRKSQKLHLIAHFAFGLCFPAPNWRFWVFSAKTSEKSGI